MIKGSLALVNIVAVVLMLVVAASVYVNPNSLWYFSFAGMLFLPLMLVNAAFVVFWLLFRKFFALVSVAALLLCYQFVLVSFGFNFQQAQPKAGDMKVMVWNVKNFDLYNWTKNLATRADMMQLIKTENADILCLQEFYTDSGNLMNNLKYLTDTLGYRYYHFEPTVQVNRYHKRKAIDQQWGEATFSKYPIVYKGRVDFTNSRNNDCIYTDVLVQNDTLRVYNMHLQSIHLAHEDYFAIQEMEEKQEPDWLFIRKIGRKMKQGYRSRASQAEQVAKSIRKYKGHQLVCGDFNDVPVSYTYHKIAHATKLQDAFVQKGFGLGKTLSNKFFYFRIDHVLATMGIAVNSYKTIPNEWSDHYPICVSFQLK